MSELIPALIIIVCSNGHFCHSRNAAVYIAQPDFPSCIEALKAMPAQPRVLHDEQEFAFTATCGLAPSGKVFN
jgi:hypothetical protein